MAIVINLLRICLRKGLDLSLVWASECAEREKKGSEAFWALVANTSVIPIYTERKPWLYPDSDHSARSTCILLVTRRWMCPRRSQTHAHNLSLFLSLMTSKCSSDQCCGVVVCILWSVRLWTVNSLVCGGWRGSDMQEHSASRVDLLIENKTACVCVCGRWWDCSSEMFIPKGSALLSKGHHLSPAWERGKGATWISHGCDYNGCTINRCITIKLACTMALIHKVLCSQNRV